MFGRYALPQDDLLVDPLVIVTASAEDSEYPAENITGRTTSGHLNVPSRPAKLTQGEGWWKFDLGSAQTVYGAALLYHSLDETLQMTLQGHTSDDFTSPSFEQDFDPHVHHDDGWPVSPWMAFDAGETYRYWRIVLAGSPSNSVDLQVGRLWLQGGAPFRQIETDVRYGGVLEEEHGLVEHGTELGVETIYDLGGKRRAFSGELGYRDDEAASLIRLARSAHSRVRPWLLIPDEDVNDAWIVRFQENKWAQTLENPNFSTFPFRVRELSRGLPWP